LDGGASLVCPEEGKETEGPMPTAKTGKGRFVNEHFWWRRERGLGKNAVTENTITSFLQRKRKRKITSVVFPQWR